MTLEIFCQRCQRTHTVQRPTQAERPPETWGQAFRRNWPEVVASVFVLLLCYFAILYAMPILFEGMAGRGS